MRKLSLLTLLGIVLGLSTAATAAGASAPSLTSTEYQQLAAYQTTAATRWPKTLAGVEAAKKSCRELSPVGALLRAGHRDCDATYVWVEASVRALARINACAPARTVAARFSCLMSAYVRVARATHTLYRDDDRLYHVVVARGFTGECSRALSDGPKVISDEAQMSKDVTKLIAAIRQRNLLAAQKWGSLYDAATAEGESAAPKVSVVLCPHR